MQDTSGHGAYNSFSLKRDFDKAELNELDETLISGSDDDDDGSDKQEETVKKTPPPNGKKTKGRVKIKMEFIDNKLRRYTTFSKRKTGIMKKAYELSTLTGTQVMLLVASETGHVYTFATRKLQPMITSEAGKALIQTCLNTPDPLVHAGHHSDQRMSATGFEETELTYTINDEDCKIEGLPNKYQTDPNISQSSCSSLAQMTLPVTTLLNSTAAQAGKQNISLQLPKSHPGFTTIIAGNHSGDSNNSASMTTSTHTSTNSNSLPLMYQTSQGVIYAPTTTTDGVILSLGQNSAMTFSQETRNNSGQQYVTVPLSFNPSSHMMLTKQSTSKWTTNSLHSQHLDGDLAVTDLSKNMKRE